jgi:hypothetical protein
VVADSFSTGTLTVYVSHAPGADVLGITVTCALAMLLKRLRIKIVASDIFEKLSVIFFNCKTPL